MDLQLEQEYINSVVHEGKIILFATASDGAIYYTVKQQGYEDGYEDRRGWEYWRYLSLPASEEGDRGQVKVIPDPSVEKKEAKDFTYEENRHAFYLYQSRYNTWDQSAVAPVQLVSAMGYLYVFRQSGEDADKVTPNTLLVDRFVLDKMRNCLVRKLEVRFKRSRQRYLSSEQEVANAVVPRDSLDFRDIEQHPFYEPTIELSLIGNLHRGWFCVVLVPTLDSERFRWHIFAHNNKTKKVEVFSLWASPDKPFDFSDQRFLMPLEADDSFFSSQKQSAIIRRTLDLGEAQVTHGLTATSYHTYSEEDIGKETVFLKKEKRVMLFIPMDKDSHTAAISFAVAKEGSLSQINESAESSTVLRCDEHMLELSPNVLKKMPIVAPESTVEQGSSVESETDSLSRDASCAEAEAQEGCNDDEVAFVRRDVKGQVLAEAFFNEALLSVISGEMYEETFLFKVDDGIDFSALSQKRFFCFQVWGQYDDISDGKRVTIEKEEEVFSLFGRGVWLRASCKFVVPEGLSFIRTFGISDFCQDWSKLTVREHRLVRLCNTVTETVYTDKIVLSVLPNPEEDLIERLKRFAAQEKQETLLIERKRLLKEYIARIEDPQMTRRAVSVMTGEINHFKEKNRQLFKAYDQARKSVLNYWFKLTLKDKQYTEYMLHVDPHSREVRYARVRLGGDTYPWCRFFLRPADKAYYHLICGYEGLMLCIDKEGRVGVSMGHNPLDEGCLWQFEVGKDKGYLIRNKIDNRILVLDKEGGDDVTTVTSEGTYSNLWKIEKAIVQSSSDMMDQARYRFINNANLLRYKNKEQERLQYCMVSDADDNFRFQAELYENAEQVNKLQAEQDKTSAAFLKGVESITYSRQSMPSLYQDKRGLVTYGAWLGFINANSPISVLASCEGEVVLHYFNEDACLSVARCSVAASDGNAFSEEWLPQEPPVCLRFSKRGDRVDCGPSIDLSGLSFTILFWVKRDSDDRYNFILGQGLNEQQQGLYIGFSDDIFTFSFISDDLHTTQNEDFDWHHWACVYDSATRKRLIYRDGILVAEDKAKDDYQGRGAFIIGGSEARGKEFYGKLAEFSIWEKALSTEEVMLHSKVTLRGDEPGLLVYYRMNEITNGRVDDASTNHIHGKVEGATLCPRTAPIGHLQTYAMCFDGENDFLTLSDFDADFSSGITLECWLYLNNCDSSMAVIDFGNGVGKDTILFLAHDKTAQAPTFHFYQDECAEYSYCLSAREPLEQNQWIHLALTIERNGMGMLYKNGELIVCGEMPLPVSTLRTKNYIGKSSDKEHFFLNGKLSELRLWRTARSQEQIQQTMRLRLSKNQEGLAGYWPMSNFLLSVDAVVPDMVNKCDAIAHSALLKTDMHLPIGSKAISVMEYPVTYQDTNSAERNTLINRHVAYTHRNSVTVLADQPIGQLERKWVGHRHCAPILLGYIEPTPFSSYSSTRNRESARASMGILKGSTLASGLSKVEKDDEAFIFVNDDEAYEDGDEALLLEKSTPRSHGRAAVAKGLFDIFILKLEKQKTVFDYDVCLVEGTPLTIEMIPFQISEVENKKRTVAIDNDSNLGKVTCLEQSIALKEKEREAYYFNHDGLDQNNGIVDEEAIVSDNNNTISVKSHDLFFSIKAIRQKYTYRRNLILSYFSERRKKERTLAGLVSWYQSINSAYQYACRHNIVHHYTWDETQGLSLDRQSAASVIDAEYTTNFPFFNDSPLGLKKNDKDLPAALTAWECTPMRLSLSRGESFGQWFWELDIAAESLEADASSRLDCSGDSLLEAFIGVCTFSSFFLESKTSYFNDFFSTIVDPLWVREDTTHASLFRQIVKAGTVVKTWHVLHYVTSVKYKHLFSQDNYQKDSDKKDGAKLSYTDTEKMLRLVKEVEHNIGEQIRRLLQTHLDASTNSDGGHQSALLKELVTSSKRLEREQMILKEQVAHLSKTIRKIKPVDTPLKKSPLLSISQDKDVS